MSIATQIKAGTHASTPPLSALEWKVVSLAMREAGDQGGEARRGWFGRMLARSTGARPLLPLADPRLEALRRFVNRVRNRADVSDLKQRLVELGFEPGQISAVAMLVR